jgi:hypothetical protein
MLGFATNIQKTNPDLARELRIWAEEESRLEDELVRGQNKDDDDDGPECSPYVDYLGTPIYEGSRVQFGDGGIGTVMIRKHISEDDKRWVVKPLHNTKFYELAGFEHILVVDDDDDPPREE